MNRNTLYIQNKKRFHKQRFFADDIANEFDLESKYKDSKEEVLSGNDMIVSFRREFITVYVYNDDNVYSRVKKYFA